MSKYQIFRLKDQGEQCWCWHLRGDDGRIIAHSEEAFLKGSIISSVKKIRQEAKKAPVWKNEGPEDQDRGYRFEYDQNDKDGTWHWRLRAGNHETMAIGEGYVSEDSIKDVLEDIKKVMCSADITWENEEDDPDHQAKQDDRTETKGIAGS